MFKHMVIYGSLPPCRCSLLPFVMYLWCCLHLVLYVIKICFYILFIRNKNMVWSVLRNTCIMQAARCICITIINKLLMFMASGMVYLSEIKERCWASTVPHFLSFFLVYYVDIKKNEKKNEYIRRATCPLSHNWTTVFCGNCDSRNINEENVHVNININIKYLQTNMKINVIGVTSTT